MISSDVSTGGDLAYLTHLTLYWSTGLLVIGVDGATIFLPALSPRTENWFGETGLFDEVRSGTDLIGSLAAALDGHGYRRIGLVERGRFPQGLLRGIESDRRWEVEDLGDVVREARAVPDDATMADLAAAHELAEAALERFAEVLETSSSASDAGAEAEFLLRSGGAWDASVTSVPLDASRGVRLRVQLRDAWVAIERVVGGDAATRDLSDALGERLLDRLSPGVTAAELRAELDELVFTRDDLSGLVREVVLEPACDVEARPVLAPLAPVSARMAVHVSVEAWDAQGDERVLWGNTVLIDEAGRSCAPISEGKAG